MARTAISVTSLTASSISWVGVRTFRAGRHGESAWRPPGRPGSAGQTNASHGAQANESSPARAERMTRFFSYGSRPTWHPDRRIRYDRWPQHAPDSLIYLRHAAGSSAPRGMRCRPVHRRRRRAPVLPIHLSRRHKTLTPPATAIFGAWSMVLMCWMSKMSVAKVTSIMYTPTVAVSCGLC